MILAMGMLIMGVLTLSGCGINPQTKVAQGEKIIITAVNDGIKIIVKKINAGQLTQRQCDTFNSYYQKYYDAQMVVKAAIEKVNSAGATATMDDVNRAQTAVNQAEAALLNFINSLL